MENEALPSQSRQIPSQLAENITQLEFINLLCHV